MNEAFITRYKSCVRGQRSHGLQATDVDSVRSVCLGKQDIRCSQYAVTLSAAAAVTANRK